MSDNMYVTYEFYKDVYYGSKLKEEDFNKFISKACNVISSYTFDRINENTINKFPPALVNKIKKCACELAEFNLDVERVNSLSIPKDDGTIGLVSSKKAGEVSVSYDSSKVFSSYTNDKYISNRYKTILNDYLYPQQINGKYYNLLSWVNDNVCKNNYIIQLHRSN